MRKLVHGPYEGKDGRLRVMVEDANGYRSVISYPKYLMEQHLGRELKPNETIHHKDHNPLNNSIDNLEVIDRAEHARLHAVKKKDMSFLCPICSTKFALSGRKLHDAIQNRKKGKAGPFCSRSCAGKYGALLQQGKIKPLEVKQITPQYTSKN